MNANLSAPICEICGTSIRISPKHFVFSDKRMIFAFEIKRLYKANGLVALSVGHRPTGKDGSMEKLLKQYLSGL